MNASGQLWDTVVTDLMSSTESKTQPSWLNDIDVISCSPHELIVRTHSELGSEQLQALSNSFRRICGDHPKIQVVDAKGEGALSFSYSLKPDHQPTLPELDTAFSLDYFVTGPNNSLAYSAALAVAATPGVTYNPLFLHGSTGQGKTHLLHALTHRALELHPHFTAILTTADELARDLQSISLHTDANQIRDRYRQADIIAIDNINLLPDHSSIQDELAHLLDALTHHGCQIVVTSRVAPSSLRTLNERLLTRLTSGLVAHLTMPDKSTREAIIRRRAARNNSTLPDNVVRLLARQVTTSPADLNAVTLKLIGFAALAKRTLNLDLAREVLALTTPPTNLPTPVHIEDVAREICTTYHLPLDQLKSSSRVRSIAFPRQVSMYLCRVLTKHTLRDIGNYFGGRDHSTVKHAYEKIRRLVDSQQDLNLLVESLRKNILEQRTQSSKEEGPNL